MTDKIGHGKWAEAGVPHRGWKCLDVIDLDDNLATCQMC